MTKQINVVVSKVITIEIPNVDLTTEDELYSLIEEKCKTETLEDGVICEVDNDNLHPLVDEVV